MANYAPVFIWTASAIVCAYIANRRGLRATALRSVVVALVGPFAIPFALMLRADKPGP
jgi:hypothetical protein